MKSILICHEGAKLEEEGLGAWLASFSDLAGIVILREKGQRKFKRVRKEIERSGFLRFLDVAAFRVFYKLRFAADDLSWELEKLREIKEEYGALGDVPRLVTHSPNSKAAEKFLKEHAPDIVIARCKVILQKRIFSIAKTGTFVMHPGICPEYRNAHGCFWALAAGDTEKVGMTLLKIDEGVDTGPVYGYFSYDFDSLNESHIKIQTRVVLDNLDAIRDKLIEIHEGKAEKLDTEGRESGVWGHPWLSQYIKWKRRARREGK
ncbi:MAG: hypothetical protein KIS76_11595 [Pyrinomonadaceae bacterium]|nr:hypothetical protein [Pyrinomonadaceae bacterium]